MERCVGATCAVGREVSRVLALVNRAVCLTQKHCDEKHKRRRCVSLHSNKLMSHAQKRCTHWAVSRKAVVESHNNDEGYEPRSMALLWIEARIQGFDTRNDWIRATYVHPRKVQHGSGSAHEISTPHIMLSPEFSLTKIPSLARVDWE